MGGSSMDISTEIAAIQAASQGSELRQPLVGALNKLNSGTLPAVTVSDVGKILKVGANGWEVGEKSGYMPVPTDTMQITDNGIYNVTNYASANVHISGGGSAVLVPKTITKNGTYDPANDNADGYSEVIVNVDPYVANPIQTHGEINLHSVNVSFDAASKWVYPILSNNSKISLQSVNSYECCVAFTCSALTNNFPLLWGADGINNYYDNPWAIFGNNIDSLIAYAVFPTSSSSIIELRIEFSELAFNANAAYKCIIGFDGTNVYLKVSDGVTEITKTQTVTGSLRVVKPMQIGGALDNNRFNPNVAFDLSKSYIKINGAYVWGS